MSLERIYKGMPRLAQSLALNLHGYKIKRRRFNSSYYRYLRIYQGSDPSSVDIARLRLFMREALAVPYWREMFEKTGVCVAGDDPVAEIKKLPILEKKFVKNNIDLFVNKKHANAGYFLSTSGTTGSPLRFPCTHDMENRQWAVWTRYRSWHGISHNAWMGWFGGKMIMGAEQGGPPFWHVNFPMKQLMFSCYHLSPDTVVHYYNKIKSSKVSWLHGYPSQLSLFARLIESKNLGPLPDVKIVTVGSESLSESQRLIMQHVFGAPVRQHYGLAEGVANISETVGGKLLCDQDFCLTELVSNKNYGSNVKRIVGTNYNNFAFPLFRYDTGDLAVVAAGTDEIISLDGRVEDYISLKDGRKIGRLANVFSGMSTIIESQIHQVSLKLIKVNVVKGDDFEPADVERIKRRIKDVVGDEVEVEVFFLDTIPRTKSGKLRFVVSDV